MASTRTCAGLALLLALGLAGPAAAQSPPDMVGTWRGQSRAVTVGPTPYRPQASDEASFAAQALDFSYRIDRQDGNRFIGETSAGTRRERLIGAISGDNRTGIMQDEDGQSSFTLRSPDVMDICYAHHAGNNRAVTCFTLTRNR